jgi:hypothetical protein
MTEENGAKPTLPGGSDRTTGVVGVNPTPLDAIFIVSASVALLLFLLWILEGGGTRFSNAPHFLEVMVNSLWTKLSFAGGSAVALLLRWLFVKQPSPNYIIWIPSFIVFLIVALYMLSKIPIAPIAPNPVQSLRMHLSLGLDKKLDAFDLFHKEGQPDFKLWESLPDQIDPHGVYYNPAIDPRFPYRDTLNVRQDGRSEAYIKLASVEGDTRGSDLAYDYKICLHSGASMPGESNSPRIVLSCKDGACSPAPPDDPGYVVGMDCDAKVDNTGNILPVVFAGEQTQQLREPGWNVPSVTTLQKMNDQQRPGYTLFDVSFIAQGKAALADRYYYALRVNDQPVYIDGLSPGLEKEPLQRGGENHIVFGLENLNFTGLFEGNEKLHLTVYFLSGNTPAYRQDLDREYIALRDAAAIAPIQTEAGAFVWTGKYISPKNQNKYEVILASADCGDPPQKDCVDHAVYAKKRFDKAGLKLGENPIVMVVRPPLRKHEAYGLSFGLVQPTGQVQFTFNDTEADRACQWAAENAGQSGAGKLINRYATRYDVETRGYAHCR